MAAARHDHGSQEVIEYEEAGVPVLIVYDTWTPRPHFAIIQRQPKQSPTTDELQATFELIGRFLARNPQFDNEAILSFHWGKWYQQNTAKWHAHLCVPDQPYLEKAKDKFTVGTNNQWKGAKTVEEGLRKWHSRKLDEYKRYQAECVAKLTLNATAAEAVSLSQFNSDSAEFELIWTSPEPRIGVRARRPNQSSLASLYAFMTKFYTDAEKALSQRDPNFIKFGCHLCLFVRGQNGTQVTRRSERVGNIAQDPDLVGYIQMGEPEYAQWIPRDMRRKWRDEFRQIVHYVRT